MNDESHYFMVVAHKLFSDDGKTHTIHYTFGPFHGAERTELCMLELAKHENTLGAEMRLARHEEILKLERRS